MYDYVVMFTVHGNTLFEVEVWSLLERDVQNVTLKPTDILKEKGSQLEMVCRLFKSIRSTTLPSLNLTKSKQNFGVRNNR